MERKEWFGRVREHIPVAGVTRVRVRVLHTDRPTDPVASTFVGNGRFTVERIRPDAIVLEESGTWKSGPLAGARFRNTYEIDDTLRIAHLRRGPELPQPLVELVPRSDVRATSSHPFVCGADLYSATLRLVGRRESIPGLALQWFIRGPKKNQRASTFYTPDT